MNKAELRERRFAHAVRTALNESAGQLPTDVCDRLAAARRMALAQKKAEAPRSVRSAAMAIPGMGSVSFDLEGRTQSPLQRAGAFLRRLGLLWPTIALMAGLAGIYQWQQQQRVDELPRWTRQCCWMICHWPPTPTRASISISTNAISKG